MVPATACRHARAGDQRNVPRAAALVTVEQLEVGGIHLGLGGDEGGFTVTGSEGHNRQGNRPEQRHFAKAFQLHNSSLRIKDVDGFYTQERGRWMQAKASTSEAFGNRNPRHDGLERVLVNVGTPVRIVTDFRPQSVNVPELGGRRVLVEQIVDA